MISILKTFTEITQVHHLWISYLWVHLFGLHLITTLAECIVQDG